ncbi:MAG: hypothetical protein MJ152_04120 [Clostridia bacterium]|nr:hypothetical protein [Clostridia bacterium]
MKVKLKSNKIIILLLFVVCAIFITNPSTYAQSCLNGISVWAVSVVPMLFPFFVFTRIIVNLITPKQNKAEKIFNKIYNAPPTSLSVFLLSALSGYPMGAKLICSMQQKGIYTKQQAKRMFAFMLGTIGIAFLKSYTAGIIIAISNVLACLINGLIYRGKKEESTPKNLPETTSQNVLTESVFDAVNSILMVGGFVALSFLLVDMLLNLKIIGSFASVICHIFNIKNTDVVSAFIVGTIEITRGVLELSATSCPIWIKTLLASGLVGFGGVSIIGQSFAFLRSVDMPIRNMLLQKFTQGLLAIVCALPLCFIFLR